MVTKKDEEILEIYLLVKGIYVISATDYTDLTYLMRGEFSELFDWARDISLSTPVSFVVSSRLVVLCPRNQQMQKKTVSFQEQDH